MSLLSAAHDVVTSCQNAAPVVSSSSQDKLWDIVGVVFIAEFVFPGIVRAVKGIGGWLKDLRDLRGELYEDPNEDETEEDDEEDEDE